MEFATPFGHFTCEKVPQKTLFAGVERLQDESGPWENTKTHVDRTWLHDALYKRIASIDWLETSNDVRRFIPVGEQFSIKLWSAEVFLQQLDTL
ncbi:hypothetical protein [uncultured Sphaerochaeta sp.]|uniref:hypothetical protein n=1 Tax=uncultured Sphaerochaeta sp. TaxID=886478 RepID=UPI002A0A9AC4|nr:hypothetical protein [uncultured Sphaerochaeta sp.]